MAKKSDDKGHSRPKLIKAEWSIRNWEMCTVCHETRLRGSKWRRPCPGPAPEKRYMGG